MINWQWKTFEELSKQELYKILQMRNNIFIVDIKCPWDDIDGQDEQALHLLAYDDQSKIVAYARLLTPKNETDSVHFGRVLVVKEYRNQGLGNTILVKILNKIAELGNQSRQIDILANYTPTTETLYKRFGFQPTGEPYTIEGGSQLIAMTRLPSKGYQDSNKEEVNRYSFLNSKIQVHERVNPTNPYDFGNH